EVIVKGVAAYRSFVPHSERCDPGRLDRKRRPRGRERVASHCPYTLKCRDPYVGLVPERIRCERLTRSDSSALEQKMVGIGAIKCAKSCIACRSGRRVGLALNSQNPKRLQASQLPPREPAFAHQPAAQPIVTVPCFTPVATVL